MKLARTIRFDESDDNVFTTHAAEGSDRFRYVGLGFDVLMDVFDQYDRFFFLAGCDHDQGDWGSADRGALSGT